MYVKKLNKMKPGPKPSGNAMDKMFFLRVTADQLRLIRTIPAEFARNYLISLANKNNADLQK